MHNNKRTMSGRAKGISGIGKGGAKRHRRVLRDTVQGITKPAIRRLARRGGVKRIGGLIYEETRGVLKAFLENIIRDAVTYTEHARRKTVSALDCVYALKRQGHTLYGFGAPDAGQSAAARPRHRSSRRRHRDPSPTPSPEPRETKVQAPQAQAPKTKTQAQKVQQAKDVRETKTPRLEHVPKTWAEAMSMLDGQLVVEAVSLMGSKPMQQLAAATARSQRSLPQYSVEAMPLSTKHAAKRGTFRRVDLEPFRGRFRKLAPRALKPESLARSLQAMQFVRVYHQKDLLPRAADAKLAVLSVPAVNVHGDRNVAYVVAGPRDNGLPRALLENDAAASPAGGIQDPHRYVTSRLRRAWRHKAIISPVQRFAVGGYGGNSSGKPAKPVQTPLTPQFHLVTVAGASVEAQTLEYIEVLHPKARAKLDIPPGALPLWRWPDADIKELYAIGAEASGAREWAKDREYLEHLDLRPEVLFAILLQDTHLWLQAMALYTRDVIAKTGGTVLLRLPAVGAGFFAHIPHRGAMIGHEIARLLMEAFVSGLEGLMTEQRDLPWVAVEFPCFTATYALTQAQRQRIADAGLMLLSYNAKGKPVMHRDILSDVPKDAGVAIDHVLALNPGDAFSLPGNEMPSASVEAMLGNNTDLRFVQSFHHNPLLWTDGVYRAVDSLLLGTPNRP
jgi:histone H4